MLSESCTWPYSARSGGELYIACFEFWSLIRVIADVQSAWRILAGFARGIGSGSICSVKNRKKRYPAMYISEEQNTGKRKSLPDKALGKLLDLALLFPENHLKQVKYEAGKIQHLFSFCTDRCQVCKPTDTR